MSVKILQALYILFFVPFTYTIYICPSEEGSAQPQVARDVTATPGQVSRRFHEWFRAGQVSGIASGFAQVSREVLRGSYWLLRGPRYRRSSFTVSLLRVQYHRSYRSNKKYIQNSLLGPKQEASLHPNR